MKLVFFLEERSAKEMLDSLLPRLLPEAITCEMIYFDGKQDLERQLPRKLRHWLEPNVQFIILRDKDNEDCLDVKTRLRQICNEARRPNTIIRIVCCELESWYLGDLQAVENALGIKNLAQKQNKANFRNPDILINSAQELKKITNQKYQKINGSRLIGRALNPDANKSHSFNVFIKSIRAFAVA